MADNLNEQSEDATQIEDASVTAPEAPETDEAEAAQSDDDIIKRAREFLKQATESETDIRRLALEDIEFSIGKQWPDNIEQDRNRDGRPCLVINRVQQFVQQVSNDQRQNRPCIKVHPVSDGAREETAEVIQGLIRHIEYNSNAEVAYDRAFDSAVRGGFGFWRVVTDFASPKSFDQEIYIKSIRNAFSVFLDPNAQEPDGSDADEGMICEYLTKDEFQRQYPNAELNSAEAWASVGNMAPGWMRDGSVCVSEYFYKVWVDEPLHLLSTGETVKDKDLQGRLAQAAQAGIQVSVVKTRTAKCPYVKWIKMNGIEILERGDWAGRYIPIIPVYGNEVHANGKKHLEGIVRHAKDPQRMLNYWKSAATETIALAPRAPFVGAEGQFEGHEGEWQTANRRNHSYLQYKPVSLNGTQAPPPARQAYEPPVQAITQSERMAADDLKATTGIYDPSLGAGPADTSGVAIQRRNNQAQTANFHFVDNLTRAIRHTGRICVDLIPRIYDTARSSRIIGEDGTHKIVRLNQTHKDEAGEEQLYDLDAGTYDVTMDVGPSFASKRQEAAASMQSLAQSYPEIMKVAGDLFVKNMDWPGAQEISERIKKTLPPGLSDDPGKPQIPPQIQAQMQQMGQMIDQLTAHLNSASQEIATKRFELEHKERIALAQINADIEINLAKMGSTAAIAALTQDIGVLRHQMSLVGMGQPIGDDQQQSQAPGGQPAAAPQPTGGQPPGTSMEQ
ncbi:MAG: portal protein [Pseudomonadota bacterium]